jgi:periplasmic copper chaperone A
MSIESGSRARMRRLFAESHTRLAAIPLAVALFIGPAAALAHDYALGNLQIAHPYARPTPPGARTGGAYFTVRNNGEKADRLLRVGSPAAQSVELHSMTMDGNLMKMRAIPALDIPAGAKVTLGSGGYHVMLVNLAHPLTVGTSVPLTLTFERAGSIDVSAPVEPAKPGAEAPHGH